MKKFCIPILFLICLIGNCNVSGIFAAEPSSDAELSEFDRAFEPKTFSGNELKSIELLWSSTCKNSCEVKKIIDSLLKSGKSMSQVQELLDDVLNGKPILSLAPASNPQLMSLTISSLEPGYPASGDRGPAFLLPNQAKISKGMSLGPSIGSVAPNFFYYSQLSRIFRRMSFLKRAYERRLTTLPVGNAEIQTEHEEALERECQHLRRELVKLSGEDAVREIDAAHHHSF